MTIDAKDLEKKLAELKRLTRELEEQLHEVNHPEVEEPVMPVYQAPPKPQKPPKPMLWGSEYLYSTYNGLYDIGNVYCVLKTASNAVEDAYKVVGGACALGASTSPRVRKIGLVCAAITGIVAGVEYATRYEDEEGNTKHKCAIM